ncbi:hypothetical protein F5887DRAFT_974428 [Amanita rubescens]|nr:hypothetical protein F5887DRAFT_974428 [Amanita rubescens]
MVDVAVSQGHVRLILLQNDNLSFYLQIPLDIINKLCMRPRKYLRFLGWCILGVEGQVVEDASGIGIGDKGGLTDQMMYRYIPDEELDPASIVDLEVIKARTNVPSETTQTRDDFALWLQLIVRNRPSHGENVATLNNINDIRNGIFASSLIHASFDKRLVVVLKTPNHILETEDVPERANREIIADVVYPYRRYTLQWLEEDDRMMLNIYPNNSDATFRRATTRQKPSDLLLHYNYGAAPVKMWGHNTIVLKKLAKPPRPQVPGPIHNRLAVARKRAAAQAGARARGRGRAKGRARARMGTMVESEGQAEWDEDDVMLFCWGNTKAAQERHLRKANEDARRIEQWRGGVPQGSA